MNYQPTGERWRIWIRIRGGKREQRGWNGVSLVKQRKREQRGRNGCDRMSAPQKVEFLDGVGLQFGIYS